MIDLEGCGGLRRNASAQLFSLNDKIKNMRREKIGEKTN